MELTSLNTVLKSAERAFRSAGLYFGHGTNNAWDEAVALALFILKLAPNVDASVGERVLSPEEQEIFAQLVHRRIFERIPVPYLSQEAWFANLKFYVDQRVIIPRSPMAELILAGFQPWLSKRPPVQHILDLCTGSACIAIACAKQFPNAQVDAVDISAEALAVAQHNVELHHCQKQVRLIQADLFEGCKNKDLSEKRYDLIISNPPYVDAHELRDLPREYHWEPRLALAAGSDGLSLVRRILKEAPVHLKPQGLLFTEVGNTEQALKKQFPDFPFRWLTFERGGHGIFLLSAEDQSWQHS